jgi:hypothetical protein
MSQFENFEHLVKSCSRRQLTAQDLTQLGEDRQLLDGIAAVSVKFF